MLDPVTGPDYRAARLTLKLSRAALAQVARITPASLGKIEATRGVVRLSEAGDRVLTALWTVEEMRRIYRAPASYLDLGGKGYVAAS
jgi:hypothetical protein